MMTPLGVTRANVRPVSCPDDGLDGVGPFERAPNPRPPPLEGFAVANSTKRSPATTVSRPIERQAGRAGLRVGFLFHLLHQLSLRNLVLAGKLES